MVLEIWISPQELLHLQGNVAGNWNRFKQAFETYQTVNDIE